MSISNFFKKTALAGALLTGSLFATNAYAQEKYHEDDAPQKVEQKKQEKKISLSDDNAERKIEDMFRGTLDFRAETDPLVDTISESALIEIMSGNLRPQFGIQDVYQHFDNIDGSELTVNSVREMIACAWYAKNTKDLEVRLRFSVGREDSKFSDAISMDAGRWIYGGDIGIWSRSSGTLAVLKVYKGKGDYNATLNSGLKMDGDYETTFVGGLLRQRLHADDQMQPVQAEFDKRQNEKEAKFTIEAVVEPYWSRNKFGSLETDNTYAVMGGPAFTWSSRTASGDGSIVTLTMPQGLWKKVDTESGISQRQTHTQTYGVGAQVADSFNKHWTLSGKAAYTNNGQTIDDPGQYMHKTETRSGFNGVVELRFDF